MVKLLIVPRSKSLKKIKCDTEPTARVQAIINAYAKVNEIDPNRVKLSYTTGDDPVTKRPVRKTLKNHETLEQNGLDFSNTESLEVSAKDVGPQVGWTTVFFCEYLGPVVIHSLIYFGYYDPTYNTHTQRAAYIMTMLHYLKRIYETLFVHTFSADTMPVTYLFRNCGHYWLLNGFAIGFSIYAPQDVVYEGYKKILYHVENRTDQQIAWYVFVWLYCEAVNAYAHLKLRWLRSDGSREHRIPEGFPFNYVSFPNYLFESLGWFTFACLVNNWSCWLFWLVSTATMMVWAKQKHAKYLKEFGDRYPQDRKAMIPYIF